MNQKNFPVSDPVIWEKLKPILRHHLWRHRIPLGIGDLTTPGYLMMPDEWEACHLPNDLKGKSFIDVGSNDGFFSFEAERRHASEVVACDIYRNSDFFSNTSGWPEAGIKLAHDFLQSKVRIVNCSIMNLSSLGNSYDYVLCNNVVIWIRDVQEAIKQLTGACKGTLIISDLFDTSADKHIIREGFKANVLSVEEIRSQLKSLGWEIFKIEKRDEYQRFLWNNATFDIVHSINPVNTYIDPLEGMAADKKTVEPSRALMRCNGRVFINKIGWVDEKDLVFSKKDRGLVRNLYRAISKATGLNRLLFNLRNRGSEKGIFIFARKTGV